MTGVVTLIFLVAITALSALNQEAQSARARAAFLERALTVEARITYIAQTEPFGPRGIRIGDLRNVAEVAGLMPSESSGMPRADLRLDGRPYRMSVGDAEVVVHLQDQAGLVNIARLDDEGLRRLASAIGVPPGQVQTIVARYKDYVDTDDLKQTNGAERRDYPNGGPANRPLVNAAEFLSVLGAREAVDARLWRQLRRDVVVDIQEFPANVNTASALTLQIRFGLTPDQARAAIAAREETDFFSLRDLESVSGAVLPDADGIFTYPSGRIVFTIEDERSRWTYRGRLAISPGQTDRPFWIDQTDLSERQVRETGTDTRDAPEFPYPEG